MATFLFDAPDSNIRSVTVDSTRGIENVGTGELTVPVRYEFMDGLTYTDWMPQSVAMARLADLAAGEAAS